MDRLTEFVELLDRLLTTDGVDHTGEYFTTQRARTLPGCVQRPRVPFVMAANGPRSLRLATRYGAGWVTTGPKGVDQDAWWDTVGELNRRLDDLLAADDRPPGALERHLLLDSSPRFSLSSVDGFEEMVGRADELGFTDVIAHWPRAEGVHSGDVATLEAVAADVLPRWRTTAG